MCIKTKILKILCCLLKPYKTTATWLEQNKFVNKMNPGGKEKKLVWSRKIQTGQESNDSLQQLKIWVCCMYNTHLLVAHM